MSWFFGALSASLPVIQASDQHTEGLKEAARLHQQAIEQAAHQHAQAMSHDTELARRESRRDLWAQKNHRTQTLMIVDTLMFSCGFALIVEGMPPENTPATTVTLFAASLALSFSCLFLSVWFSMTLQSRMTGYLISSPRIHYSCGLRHVSFESYYKCHCLQVEQLASAMFYFGTAMLVVTACLLMYARFMLVFMVPSAAYIFIVISATAILSLFVLGRIFPAPTLEKTLSEQQPENVPLHLVAKDDDVSSRGTDRESTGAQKPIASSGAVSPTRPRRQLTMPVDRHHDGHRRLVELHQRTHSVQSLSRVHGISSAPNARSTRPTNFDPIL